MESPKHLQDIVGEGEGRYVLHCRVCSHGAIFPSDEYFECTGLDEVPRVVTQDDVR
jgi:hypothetical protein